MLRAAMPRRALLVIDVQNEYFDGNLPIEHPPVAGSLPRILRAMDAAQAAGVPVVVVQHLAAEDAPVFAAGSHGAALHPQVAARPHALSLEKRQASAFAGTIASRRRVNPPSVASWNRNSSATAMHCSGAKVRSRRGIQCAGASAAIRDVSSDRRLALRSTRRAPSARLA